MPLVSTSNNRLLLGALLLFAVDLIWVLSSELSDHIYHQENYDKPFFTVFIKTGMFTVFLLGRISCCGKDASDAGGGGGAGYRLITDIDADVDDHDPSAGLGTATTHNHPRNEDAISGDGRGGRRNRLGEDVGETDEEELQEEQPPSPLLSSPAFVPINYNTDDNASDDNNSSDRGSEGNNKAVKFSKVAEVRHMSPKDAHAATFSRMSYHASLQAQDQFLRSVNRLSTIETARVALTFCGMWFLANYTYALSISTSSNQVALINVLSSTSSLFTLFLSAAFPSTPAAYDRLTVSKLLCVVISISGVTVISLEKTTNSTGGGVSSVGVGAVWALVSAGFYAGYLVFLRRSVEHEDRMDVFLFFGFVGLFNVLLLWPLFLVLHYSGLEPFQWPSQRQWLFLLVNGVVGTVFSEVLWVWSCLLTSSLIATIAISVTIPMSMIADVFFKQVSYTWWFYVGSVPVVLAFIGVTALGNWGDCDPVGDLFSGCWSKWTEPAGGRRQDAGHEDTTTLLDDEDTTINS